MGSLPALSEPSVRVFPCHGERANFYTIRGTSNGVLARPGIIIPLISAASAAPPCLTTERTQVPSRTIRSPCSPSGIYRRRLDASSSPSANPASGNILRRILCALRRPITAGLRARCSRLGNLSKWRNLTEGMGKTGGGKRSKGSCVRQNRARLRATLRKQERILLFVGAFLTLAAAKLHLRKALRANEIVDGFIVFRDPKGSVSRNRELRYLNGKAKPSRGFFAVHGYAFITEKLE